jgi:hypothetical protein
MCLAIDVLVHICDSLFPCLRNQSAACRDQVATGPDPSEVNQDAKYQFDRLDRRVCKVRSRLVRIQPLELLYDNSYCQMRAPYLKGCLVSISLEG